MSGSTGAQDYRGPSAFSEPETRAERDIVAARDAIFERLADRTQFALLE